MPRKLPPTALAVYSYLRSRANGTSTVSASSTEISDADGCCKLSARQSLKHLARHGLIEIVPCSGPGDQTLSNSIRLTSRVEG
jgi:hypothetical protein